MVEENGRQATQYTLYVHIQYISFYVNILFYKLVNMFVAHVSKINVFISGVIRTHRQDVCYTIDTM